MSLADLPTHHLLKRVRSLREMAREAEDERTRKAILQVAQEYEAEASARSRNLERGVRKDAAD
jgi:hypothetical protein